MISPLPLQIADPAVRFELETGWELLVDPTARLRLADIGHLSGWRDVRVGLSWNAQFTDLRNYMGAAWYRTRVELPTFRDVHHALLKFGAVDYFCEVFINSRSTGTHEGGYTPFTFEITNLVHPGINEIVVHVIDPPMDEAQNRALFPEMMYNEIPHGKQNWYVQNSGIWQGVRVELCPSIYIERLDVTAIGGGNFEIEARLAGVGLNASAGRIAAATEIRFSIRDANGCLAFETSCNLGTSLLIKTSGRILDAAPWSPDSPALYTLEASLFGAVQYRRLTRFGFRIFEARDAGLFLNGESFYMRAALDQDFYPETVHTPTSKEYVREMMMKAKRLGFNVLRCHLKVAHPVYLDVADEIGMLIWSELPSWSDSWFPSDHFSALAAARTDKMFWEILIRDWNHPCIVIQTIMNESWGINLTDASQREWLKTTFNRIKALVAPLGRLVVDNSACEGNFHIKSDLDDFHQYYSMPDQAAKWDEWVEAFAARPAWTFSPYGDAERTGKEPLLVSEFGNWGLPKLPDQLPWWFDVNFGEREITKPSGVLNRFHAYKLDTLFGNFNEFAEESQWHQFVSLKHEIETIRQRDSIQGYVVTGITDVHWEVNGILDMWRNEKIFVADLVELQNADLIMCLIDGSNFYAGEQITADPLLSHYSRRDLGGAVVRWSTGSQSGSFDVPEFIAPGQVSHLERFSFSFGSVTGPKREHLQIELRDRSGHRISENSYSLNIFCRAAGARTVPVTYDPSMESSGLHRVIRESAGDDAVLITATFNPDVAAQVARGGTALLLIDSETALPAQSGLTIKARAGSDLDGRWVSNLIWIRSDRPPFSEVAFTRILGFEAASVIPDFVLQGVPPEAYEDVLSGITYGWINKNAALALQYRVGAGKLLATTFRFASYGSDPYATHLLDAFVAYLTSSDCKPKYSLGG